MELIAEVLSINMNELEESGIYFKLNSKGTPFRLILLHKSVFNYSDMLFENVENKLYCEKSVKTIILFFTIDIT